MNELRDKIAEIVGEEIGWWLSPLVKEESDRPFVADQILARIREAGYVKLAEDQSLPEVILSTLGLRPVNNTVKILHREGWRKVELPKESN